jgi:hypothetical protein
VASVTPFVFISMIEVDDSELTPEYKQFLQEWAEALSVSVEVLLGRIVVATIDGYVYIEKIPDYHPRIGSNIPDTKASC